ncbi:MAG: ModE family transcriptional regulator [Marinilabiliales bacterium]|nr:MAG: ModE family transcriptional regulator [Marinilabiliales bacterium]
MELFARIKLWIASDSGDDIMGNGRWLLLKTIDEEGSLSAAVEKLGVSYRKAWGSLNKAENSLGVKLVEKYRGGSQGGRTTLSKEGRILVDAYEEFYLSSKSYVNTAFIDFQQKISKLKKNL